MSSTPESFFSTLDGIGKRRYGGLEHAVPSWALVPELFPFKEGEKLGEDYQVTVMLRRPQGHTHAGQSTGLAGTAFTLNDARPGQYKPARLYSSEYVLREQVPYGAAAKAVEKGDAAVGGVFDEILFGMQESAAFMRELRVFSGGSEIGIIESQSGSSTTRTFTITKASWAPGIWSQAENMEIDVYGSDLTTQVNTNATIVVTACDTTNSARTVSVSGNATDLDNSVAGKYIVPRGWIGNAPTGLKKQLTNTASLFGIDPAVYGMWKPTTVTLSGKATFSAIIGAVASGVGRGMLGECEAIVSHFTWADLENDSASLRRFVDSTKGGLELGSNKITYIGPNGGNINFRMHPLMPAGEMEIIRKDTILRSGASEWTFQPAGFPKGQPAYFGPIADKAGIEVRGFMDDFVLVKRPASNIYVTGIVNASL